MCGIFCSIQKTASVTQEYTDNIITNVSKLLKHRGPDNMNYAVIEASDDTHTLIMIHTRLHIVGDSTPQPLTDSDNTIYLVINGEIFNWKELEVELDYKCQRSDCEIIIPLYKKYIQKSNNFNTFFNKINGQYSFILYDLTNNHIFISRDHIGITPLYYGYNESEYDSDYESEYEADYEDYYESDIKTNIAFCSELKGLSMNIDDESFTQNIKSFYPRKYIYTDLEKLVQDNANIEPYMHNYLDYNTYENIDNYDINYDILKRTVNIKLQNSVKLQLNDLLKPNSPEYGVLLSGGLDSSLIASIVNKILNTDSDKKIKIKTFSIGMTPNSTDLIASRSVAKFLNTDHTEFYFTPEEGIQAIKDVIWYIESYDTTTIRASTAMYLLTKKIKEQFPNIKVLFSGELSDELLSYLYGGNAPTELDFQKETIKLVSNVHLFDCLRSNKTCMANSIEVRVPFTDPNFVKHILSIPPKYKIFGKLSNHKKMEKQLLRDAFNCEPPFLPQHILYRKKEAFSDGVSNHTEDTKAPENKENWIDSIIAHCEELYDDNTFLIERTKYIINSPLTKEQLYYRETFSNLFNTGNTSELTVEYWRPNWCGENVDPSARKHIVEEFID
jgi:asparagine synthase (glutamine-hydrolysing)